MNQNEPATVMPNTSRVYARVFACLRSGELVITLLPGSGMLNGGINCTVPMELVPPDLRMPNSECDVLISGGRVMGVVRHDGLLGS